LKKYTQLFTMTGLVGVASILLSSMICHVRWRCGCSIDLDSHSDLLILCSLEMITDRKLGWFYKKNNRRWDALNVLSTFSMKFYIIIL
jgi:hypothetical protein